MTHFVELFYPEEIGSNVVDRCEQGNDARRGVDEEVSWRLSVSNYPARHNVFWTLREENVNMRIVS